MPSSTSPAAIPLPIEGRVPEGQYCINRTSFDFEAIEHGWIILQTIDNIEFEKEKEKGEKFKVEASFLYFANINDAANIHNNLLQLKGERFLRSHFIIEREESIWVAVEKIEYSLEDYKKLYPLGLDNPRARLPQNYQVIIRDIIMGMCQIHQQKLIHGYFSSKHIMIIEDRAKFGFITNSKYKPGDSDFVELKKIFDDVLGRIPNHDELIHFHVSARAEFNHWKSLQKLYFHPLLMSSRERFLLPVTADTRLRYRKNGILDQISKFKVQFGAKPEWKIVVSNRNDWYSKVLEGRTEGGYHEGDAWHLFKFVRNAIVHINENIRKEKERRKEKQKEIQEKIRLLENRKNRENEVQNLRRSKTAATCLEIKGEADVETELSEMFPYFLIKVYDFLSLSEIIPSGLDAFFGRL